MSDKELINNCINTYYEGCIESDPNKIKEALDSSKLALKKRIKLWDYIYPVSYTHLTLPTSPKV